MAAAAGTAAEADRRAAEALLSVSRETADLLALYVDRLQAWQRVKNLVAPSTLDQVWTRHVADSAQLLPLAPDARRWVDLGSGAGFPGLVIAILLRERTGARVDLIESNARKCAFLRDVARATGAPAQFQADRIEAVLPRLEPGIEVVTARALAAFPDCVALSRSLLDCGATGLFLTGREAGDSTALPDPAAYSVESLRAGRAPTPASPGCGPGPRPARSTRRLVPTG